MHRPAEIGADSQLFVDSLLGPIAKLVRNVAEVGLDAVRSCTWIRLGGRSVGYGDDDDSMTVDG